MRIFRHLKWINSRASSAFIMKLLVFGLEKCENCNNKRCHLLLSGAVWWAIFSSSTTNACHSIMTAAGSVVTIIIASQFVNVNVQQITVRHNYICFICTHAFIIENLLCHINFHFAFAMALNALRMRHKTRTHYPNVVENRTKREKSETGARDLCM